MPRKKSLFVGFSLACVIMGGIDPSEVFSSEDDRPAPQTRDQDIMAADVLKCFTLPPFNP